MAYFANTIYSIDRRIISLRSIESIKFPDAEDGDEVIDKLKDDCCMEVTMTSGNKHIISMRALLRYDPRYQFHEVGELRSEIFKRWIFLLEK